MIRGSHIDTAVLGGDAGLHGRRPGQLDGARLDGQGHGRRDGPRQRRPPGDRADGARDPHGRAQAGGRVRPAAHRPGSSRGSSPTWASSTSPATAFELVELAPGVTLDEISGPPGPRSGCRSPPRRSVLARRARARTDPRRPTPRPPARAAGTSDDLVAPAAGAPDVPASRGGPGARAVVRAHAPACPSSSSRKDTPAPRPPNVARTERGPRAERPVAVGRPGRVRQVRCRAPRSA